MDYVYPFIYIEPSLNVWDEVYLIMVDDHFYVLLGSVCKYFIEDFSPMFITEIGL